MSARAHPPRRSSLPARLAVPVCIAATLVAMATIAVVGAGREAADPGFRFEHAMPVEVLVVVAVAVAVAALAPWLFVADRPSAAAWLSTAGLTSQLPIWAGWAELTPAVRALALALTPLVAVALAGAVAGGNRAVRTAAVLGIASAALHVAAYDPFYDVGCSELRTCAAAPRILSGQAAEAALVVATALGVAAAAAAVVGVAGSRSSIVTRLATVLVACSAGVLLATSPPVVAVAGRELPTDLVLAVATAVVALVMGAEHLRVLRTRRAVDRLIHQLETAGVAADVPDTEALTAAQRLALENALLMARSREALAETRALQRRTQERADDERARIESDLHDGAQQRLVSAAIQLGIAASTGPPETSPAVEAARGEVLEVLEALREIGHGVFPRTLLDEGLAAALDELCAEHRVAFRVVEPIAEPREVSVVRATYAAVDALLPTALATALVELRSDSAVLVVRASGCLGPLPQPVLDRLFSVGGEVTSDATGTTVVLPCVS